MGGQKGRGGHDDAPLRYTPGDPDLAGDNAVIADAILGSISLDTIAAKSLGGRRVGNGYANALLHTSTCSICCSTHSICTYTYVLLRAARRFSDDRATYVAASSGLSYHHFVNAAS